MQNNKQDNKPVFLNYVAAGYPFLWVQTHEEFRAMTTFAQELSMDTEPHSLFSWDSVDGIKLRQFEDGILKSAVPEDLDDKGLEDPLVALTWASSLATDEGMEDNSILFLQDFHHSIKKPAIIRKIRNVLPYFKATGKVLVVISHSMDLPPDLEKEITPIQFKLPTIKELDITLKGICLAADEMAKAMKKELYPKNALPVLEAAMGMTALEAEAAFALSLREKQYFDIEVINREKAAIVKKTGLLEVVEVKETLADVGGLENMKTWLKAREDCFTEEARKFGIRPPKGILLGGLPGTGKAQSLNSVIYTPKGPIKMGDIKLGDTISTPDGLTSKVKEIHPQGLKEIYEVTFNDNSKTECCGDHLWEVRLRDKRNINPLILPTKYLTDRIKPKEKGPKYNISISITKPVFFNSKKLKIDPYILGILLGDGSFGNGKETNRALSLTSYDKEIVNRVSNYIKENFPDYFLNPQAKHSYNISKKNYKGRTSIIKDILRSYGLWGKKSEFKFIPTDFLSSPIKDRTDLLKGLMDSDGTISKNNTSYSTSSQQLSVDMKNLVESLGGLCKIIPRKTFYTKKGIKIKGLKSYRCRIKFNSLNPFNLKRKAVKFNPRVKYFVKRYIKSIKFIGKKEAQCITISNKNGLYLTNNFIVTHNSLSAKCTASLMKRPLLRLDLGRVFGSYVGESESNIRKCLDIADAVAPCVLWIDELEKSFTNTKGGSGNSKGGEVSMRVYSTFLTWLQEKTSDVFIVATANDVESIDAALLRRLDVVFWVDLPDDKQRKEIIEIHLRKAGREPKNFNTKKLAEDCSKFSGSEIETWIRDEALPYAFQHGHELCDEDLLKVRPGIVPQAIMMAEDIARYRKWAEEHKVRPASKQAKKVEIPVPTKRKISLGTTSPGAAN